MKVRCYFCKRKMRKRPFGYVFYSPRGAGFLRLRERFIKTVNWCSACQATIMTYNTCVQEANKEYESRLRDVAASVRKEVSARDSLENFVKLINILEEGT